MNLKDSLLVLLAIAALVVPVCILLFWCFKRMGFGSIGLIYALIGLFGIVAFAYCARDVVLGWQSLHWLRTDGVIQSAQMIHQRNAGSGGAYGASVSYEYRVSGTSYAGTRISYGDYLTGDAEHARSLLARYRPDTKMLVFYDPDKPDRAVLETGVHGGVWLGLGIGTLFCVVAAFGLSKGRTKAGVAHLSR